MNNVYPSEKLAGIKIVPVSQALPHLAAVFLLCFALYLWSAPRTVALEDDGLFILAGFFNGIAHPPGYPLYTLLGKLASLVPISTVAFRAHALSGFFGALSCATLWYIARLLLSHIHAAYLVAFAYAVSRSFWSQAIIAEVYTLNVFIFLLLLVQALLFTAHRDNWQDSRLPFLMVFMYGLGISNHWPLLVLSTPCLLLMLWPALPFLLRRIHKLLPFLMLGLTPYLWMVLRSQMQPVISFSGPIDSWEDFWYVFSRKMYAHVDSSTTADWHDKYQYAGFQLKEFLVQFGWLGTALVCLGFIRQWRIWPHSICWALITGFIGNSFLLILLLNFNYDSLYRKVFHVYPLISYAVEALWFGLGFRCALMWLFNVGLPPVRSKVLVFIIPSLVLIIMIPSLKVNYRANYDWAENYAATVLRNLPPNAVFFCEGELSAGPLGYLNLIEKVRPDVTLYSSNGVVFNTRLVNPIALEEETRIKELQEFINKTNRPIFNDGSLLSGYAYIDYGLFKKIEKNGPEGKIRPIILLEVQRFIQSSYCSFETDAWTSLRIKEIQRDFSMVLFYFYLTASDAEAQNKSWELIQNTVNTFQGYLIILEAMLKQYPNDYIKIEWLLKKAEALLDGAEQKKETANFFALKEKYRKSKN